LYFLPRPQVVQEIPLTSVLIADFENKTGLEVFDGVLEQCIAVGLKSASFIRLFERKRAMTAAQEVQPNADSLPPKLAQLIALRAGVDLVTVGSIAKQDDGFEIRVDAINPSSGKHVFHEVSSDVDFDQVITEIGKISIRFRQELGDRTDFSAEVIQRETFTAANLEAAHSYAEAQELLWAGKDQEALPYFQEAIDLDPGFGRAYSGIAMVYRNRGENDKALEYMEEALSRIDRMTDRERLRTRGNYYVMTGDTERGVEEFKTLVERYPGDIPGYNNLAVAYFYDGEMQNALEQTRRALEIEPRNVTLRYNFAIYNLYAGHFETAAEEARKIAEENPDMLKLYICQALAEAGLGFYEKARQVYGRLSQSGREGASLAGEGMADLVFARGALDEAEQTLRDSIQEDLEEDRFSALGRKHALLAAVLLSKGETLGARSMARKAHELSEEERVHYEVAMTHLEVGDEAEALEIAQELDSRFHDTPRFYGQLIFGEHARLRNKRREAFEHFQSARDLSDQWLCHFHLGRLYLDQEEATHAYSEFEACLNRRGEAVAVFSDDLPTFRYLPQVYYYLGKAQEGLGSPVAEESFQKFLEIKKQAIGDPMIQDARTRVRDF
jgi:tetratricopeptide (TPR) repeat protein